jgi:hypothetical protein
VRRRAFLAAASGAPLTVEFDELHRQTARRSHRQHVTIEDLVAEATLFGIERTGLRDIAGDWKPSPTPRSPAVA